MSRVIVTGASGFIGRPALDALAAAGHETVAVSRRERPEAAESGVRWVRGDLLDPDDRERVVAAAKASHLLHLAWVTDPGAYWTSPDNRLWAEASVDLLQRFADTGGRRAAVAGTCAEYDWSHSLLSEGGTPLRPGTPYGTAKKELHDAAAELPLSLAWARLFFLYGPREHPERLVPAIARALLAGQPVETTDGTQLRDFLFAPDAADAIAALLQSSAEGAINVASGHAVAVRDVVEEIARATGRPELIRLGARPREPGDPPELVAEVTRLRDEVGWAPKVGLDEGIDRTVSWWRARMAGR